MDTKLINTAMLIVNYIYDKMYWLFYLENKQEPNVIYQYSEKNLNKNTFYRY